MANPATPFQPATATPSHDSVLADMDTIELFCWVVGEAEIFPVDIERGKSVGHLKKVIKAENQHTFQEIDAANLVLYKTEVVNDNKIVPTLRKIDLSRHESLSPSLRIFDAFSGHLPVNEIFIVIVRPPAVGVLGKHPRSPENFDLVITAPSTIGRPSQYMKMQLKPSQRLLDDRPTRDPDIAPISLLYSGFGMFLDIYARRKNPKNISIVQLQTEVNSFAEHMTRLFGDEDMRDSGLYWLNKIFALSDHRIPSLMPAAIGSVWSDGHFMGPHNAVSCVVEFKTECTNVMPDVELMGYVARSHVQSMKLYESMYERLRVPCLGITIVGDMITFYAILYIRQWRIIPLTPRLSCLASASDDRDRKDLYAAMAGAIDLLCCIDQDITQFLNQISKYNGRPGEKLKFQILRLHHDRQDYRHMYIAKSLDSGEEMIIKFTHKYSITLHRFCAERGHAPSILGFQDLPGDWLVIAMEYFPFAQPLSQSPLCARHLARWKVELEELLRSFHEEGLVHGDLRDPNILCWEEKVMLVDFDWAGKVGEAAYPETILNPALTFGRRSSGPEITKEDDTRVLRNTLEEAERPIG